MPDPNEVRSIAPELKTSEWRGLLLVCLNQLRIALRYQNKFRFELTAHVLMFLPIALAGWAFAGGRESSRLNELAGIPDQFLFVTLGFVAFTALGIGNMMLQDTHVAGGISFEMITGTLERLFLTPLRRLSVIMGIASYFVVLFIFQSVTLFVGAWVIYGFELSVTLAEIPLLIWSAICLLVMNVAFGLIGVSITLVTKDFQTYLLFIHRPAALLSGAYFLIDLVPEPFKFLSLINPIAHGVDTFRGAITGHPLLSSDMATSTAVTTGLTAVVVVIAVYSYRYLFRKMERQGNLSLH